MILFGFNDVQGRYNNRWHGFTLDWYAHVFDLSGLTDALKASLIIAFLSTLIATALGTLLGVALGRYRFRGAGASNLVQFAAISTPEIVMACPWSPFSCSSTCRWATSRSPSRT